MDNHNPEEDVQAMQDLALALLAYIQTGGKLPSGAAKSIKSGHPLIRRALLFSALTLIVLGFIWVGGNLFGAHFKLQSDHLSGQSSDSQLKDILLSKTKAYRLSIVRPDGTSNHFSLQEMGLHMDTEHTIERARQKQHALLNRLKWWQPIPIDLVLHTDSKILEGFITQQVSVVVEPARDATLAIVNGTVQLEKDVSGKQYGLKNADQTILKTARNLQTKPLRMKFVPLPATITHQTLSDPKTRLDTLLNQSIVITIDGQQVRPDRTEIGNWITISPDPQNKTVQLGLNIDKMQAYLNQVAHDNARPPRAQISLLQGGVIPGSHGVVVTDMAPALAKLKQNLLHGQGMQVDLPTKHTPFRTITASATGKWIEVDLTNKRLYAYEQTTLVRTFLVSAGKAATPTVTGTFAIYSKYSKKTMRGPNADGTHYVQPDVPWVNFFYRDYAIHGNYWRPAHYFGNINSSHGCVGLRTVDSAWVYHWAPIGTPVVIHT